MKRKTRFSITLIIFAFINCQVTSMFSQSVSKNGTVVDFAATGKVKKQIQQKDKRFLQAYTELINKAEKALKEGPFSVTYKKKAPPSGDKHDYLSMGPYWWPDPSKPDGLPYVRKDGEVNPETTGKNTDTAVKRKMFENVETLSWAFHFSGEVKYAKKAVELLETWFIDPRTKMNPNLNYAQGIPGICEGRGIGIIDWGGINRLISSIQILDASAFLSPAKMKALQSWFDAYLNWLCTSKYGKDEDDYFNNHGTYFDVQAAGIALFLGKTGMARERLENAKSKRIAAQIEPDGSQPHELARTKSLSYSAMNLRGFIVLAEMAQTAGVDLWNFETTDGRGIKKALDFLLPFVRGEKRWEYKQISDMEGAMESLKLNYHIAAVKTGDKKYLEAAQSVASANGPDILLYPLFE